MRAVDTNVLVRLLTTDGRVQLATAQDYVAAGAWISHLVLAEAVWVLTATYRVPRKQILAAIEVLLDHESLALQEPDVVASALETFRSNAKVGFSDCLVLEIARKAGHVPLGTFDRALGKQPNADSSSSPK